MDEQAQQPGQSQDTTGFPPNGVSNESEQFSEAAFEGNRIANEPTFAPGIPQPEPEYLLLEWLADSRLVFKRSRQYYSSLLVIVLLFSLILFFANQILLIFVLVSFLFITYVLASVKAETIHNMVTTYGIRYQNRLYYWEECSRFWVQYRRGIPQVHVELPGQVMNQIILLPSNEQSPIEVGDDQIVDVLSRFLPYEQPLPNQIDRWVEWLEEKFPLEPVSQEAEVVGAAPFVPTAPDEPVDTNVEPAQTASQPGAETDIGSPPPVLPPSR